MELNRWKPYAYLSFATDEGFRGAVIVQAETVEEAFEVATRRHLNPGGECLGMVHPDWTPNPAAVNRVLSRADIERLCPELKPRRLGDVHPEGATLSDFVAGVEQICERCNDESNKQ